MLIWLQVMMIQTFNTNWELFHHGGHTHRHCLTTENSAKLGSGWRQLTPDHGEQPNPSEWGQAGPRLRLSSEAERPRPVTGSVLPRPALPRTPWL